MVNSYEIFSRTSIREKNFTNGQTLFNEHTHKTIGLRCDFV